MKIKIRTNLMAGIIAVIFAVTVWFLIPAQIKAAKNNNISLDARFFPKIFCVIIGILGLILIIQSLVFRKDEVKEYNLKIQGKMLLYYLLIAAFGICMGLFGFLVPALVFVALSLLFLESKNKWHFVAMLLFAAAVWAIFRYGLNVTF